MDGSVNRQNERMNVWWRSVVTVAALFVIVGGIRVASPLISQILTVVFITAAVSPLYYFMRRFRIPPWLAVTLLIVFLVGAIMYIVTIALPASLTEFSRHIPAYHGDLLRASGELTDWLRDKGVDIPKNMIPGMFEIDRSQLSQFGKTVLPRIGIFVKNAVAVLIFVAFTLAEIPNLPRYRRSSRWITPTRWKLMVSFVEDIRHYLGIKAFVSALTGLLIYIGLKLLHVESAGLLGFVAFMLNFVPIIGSLIASVPGILLALYGGGGGTAMTTAALYLVVNQILGNIIEPRIMGGGFGVSPVVVLLSMLFWGWTLGPFGMIFAVPLTMAVRSAVKSEFIEHGQPDPPEK